MPKTVNAIFKNNKRKRGFRDFWDVFQQLRNLSMCCRTGHTVIHRVKRFIPDREYFCVVEQFTVSEKAYMNVMNGAANYNGREALSLYREKFPSRKMPDQKLISYLHHQLRERCSFRVKRSDADHSRHVPEMKERILSEFEDNLSRSTRAVKLTKGVRRSAVWNILHKNDFFHTTTTERS